jgi:hypothetical protein
MIIKRVVASAKVWSFSASFCIDLISLRFESILRYQRIARNRKTDRAQADTPVYMFARLDLCKTEVKATKLPKVVAALNYEKRQVMNTWIAYP